jgi:hypothetical protein
MPPSAVPEWRVQWVVVFVDHWEATRSVPRMAMSMLEKERRRE